MRKPLGLSKSVICDVSDRQGQRPWSTGTREFMLSVACLQLSEPCAQPVTRLTLRLAIVSLNRDVADSPGTTRSGGNQRTTMIAMTAATGRPVSQSDSLVCLRLYAAELGTGADRIHHHRR